MPGAIFLTRSTQERAHNEQHFMQTRMEKSTDTPKGTRFSLPCLAYFPRLSAVPATPESLAPPPPPPFCLCYSCFFSPAPASPADKPWRRCKQHTTTGVSAADTYGLRIRQELACESSKYTLFCFSASSCPSSTSSQACSIASQLLKQQQQQHSNQPTNQKASATKSTLNLFTP